MVSTTPTKTLFDFFCSVYASVPFKFIVEGEPLYIHTDLVSLHSKPLDRMMNGHMAEAQKGFATLEDVDKDTFVRFIEWAHKKYYTAAKFTTLVEDGSDSAGLCIEDERVTEKPVQRTNNPAVEDDDQMLVTQDNYPVQVIEDDDGWGVSTRIASSKKGKSKKGVLFPEPSTPRTVKEDMKHSFISRRPLKRKNAIKIPPPRGNKSSAEVYSDVFLSHARLYVFAEKYDIQSLKKLALDELHAILAVYTLYTKHTSDIINLLRYVYCNTSEPSEDVEDLRTLMTQYMGCEMDILTYDEDFRDLMIEDGGALLSDFMTMVGRRISDEVTLNED